MKKFITSLLSLALVIGMCPAMIANAEGLSGTGVDGDPYIIANADDLKTARDMINADTAGTGAAAAHYLVTEDIDLQNEAWTPIAPYAPSFTGTFDGGEHVIKNINIEMNADNYSNYAKRPALAFFGYINAPAVIKNLGLDGVSVVNNAPYVDASVCSWQARPATLAGFVGYINSTVDISNCFVKNATIAQNNVYAPVGGFYGTGGANQTPKFTNCYVYNATIIGTNASDKLGGFGGTQSYAKTNHVNCYTAQTFTTPASTEDKSFYAFGFMGEKTTAEVSNCYAEADDIIADNYNAAKSFGVTGMTKAGLVEAMTAVGYATDATINDGYPCLTWELPEVAAAEPWDGVAAESFVDGDGTEANPYKITTAAELKLASDLVNGAAKNEVYYYFSLENDIDYENNAWTPIGKSNVNGNKGFYGGFDGNGHVVKNLVIDGGDNYYCGFFGLANSATISDLGIESFTLEHSNTTGANMRVIGGFVGEARGNTKITNCYVKDSTVKQKLNYGASSSGKYIDMNLAGFVGRIDPRGEEGECIEITNCYVTNVALRSAVQGRACGFLGGTSFYTDATAQPIKITNCYANTTNEYAGSRTQFGFGYLEAAYDAEKVIDVNCYSTMSTQKGSDNNAVAILDGRYFGREGQTVDQIATAFAGLEGWQDGENINAGLPALAWEPAVYIAPYVVKQVSLAKGTVKIDVVNATAGDQVCIATYDDAGRLVSAEFKDAAATVTTTVSAEGAATVKVFVWNNYNPVIDATVKAIY